ncbi:MAG: fructose-bisphosphate aldolase class I [Hyphomonadaceae bacterium]|jgi:fructose-bisphosphate aldolase class I|nr:fructose-bisphosphate aldolase class I [Hyphomonadaceae bacterium]
MTKAMTLEQVAEAMVAPGKGILAADESTGTIKKRFDSIKAENTEANRRDYREMLFRATDAMQNHISGVILYDETIRQKSKDGTPFPQVIAATGALAGIKVDKGTKPLPFCPGEVITEGLDGLADRIKDYVGLGARFAKWRAVYDIGPEVPSYAAINANAQALARYAALCVEGGLVPIVEPELLMDGAHDIDACEAATEWILKEVYQQLYYAKVPLEKTILKPNMVIAGKKSARQASRQEVAERTVRVLKRCVPVAVPGIAFLSGGQSDEDATAHLSAMNQLGPLPWKLSFSYGRALQAAALKAWSGRSENVAAGQRAFAHRARMNGAAALGQWDEKMEKAA